MDDETKIGKWFTEEAAKLAIECAVARVLDLPEPDLSGVEPLTVDWIRRASGAVFEKYMPGIADLPNLPPRVTAMNSATDDDGTQAADLPTFPPR